MTAPFSGGRACGSIRYVCTREPVAMRNCHCVDCQHPATVVLRVQRDSHSAYGIRGNALPRPCGELPGIHMTFRRSRMVASPVCA